MNYIENANDFLRLIHSYDEVILFPLGSEGYVTLEFLRYTNQIEHICCVATDRVDIVDNTLQKFEHFLPVIPFEYLPHFRETGVVIIAAPPQMHEAINQGLVRLGFQKIAFLNAETIKQINDSLQQIHNSGQAMHWFMNHITEKITELEYRIAEQNEVCAVNTRAFAEYRNRFLGKKVVLFASGPTSKYYTPIPDAIHIGVNFAWRREDIPLNFLFTQDGFINKPNQPQVEDGFNRVQEKIFIGIYVPRNEWMTFSENLSLKENVCRFYTNGGSKNQRINQDICYHSLIDFWTVAHPALHFALFTYPKEIYLVGCDTSPTGHFYDPKKQNDMAIQNMKVGYARIKMFAKHFYPDTEIISVNPVGLKGLFHDVYTDEYLESLNQDE